MIRLRILDHTTDHILVATDEPARFEISLISDGYGHGRVLVHGYNGTEPDLDQDPDITYDGMEAAEMRDMNA